MSKKNKTENLAKNVETELPQQKFYRLPDQLRQTIVQALLTSSPKTLSVSEVNQICNTLNRLREIE